MFLYCKNRITLNVSMKYKYFSMKKANTLDLSVVDDCVPYNYGDKMGP